MEGFDRALKAFSEACEAAAHWKHFPGAAYRTRLDNAFSVVKDAYVEACRIDDLELGRMELGRPPQRTEGDGTR